MIEIWSTSRGAWLQILKFAWSLTSPPVPLPPPFTCVLLKFLSWIYRILFYWVNSSLYGESRRYLISKIAPDSATWRPFQFAFKWPLTFRCLSALFCALLPIFLLSFDLNLTHFRCLWLLVALWRVFSKHNTRLQTTKVVKHPEAKLCWRVWGSKFQLNTTILCSPLGPRI